MLNFSTNSQGIGAVVADTCAGKIKWWYNGQWNEVGPSSSSANGIDSLTFRPGNVLDTLVYWSGGNPVDWYYVVNKDGLLSGGQVIYTGSGLNYFVTAATFRKNGQFYTTNDTTLTLPDLVNTDSSRTDVFVVNTSGQATTIQGVESANPLTPQINPDTDVFLTTITLRPSAPAGVDTVLIYDENVEWTGGVLNGATANFAATIDPYRGTLHTDVGTISNNQMITYTTGGSLDRNDYDGVAMFIKLKAPLTGSSKLRFIARMNSTNVSNEVVIPVNATNTTNYQPVTIPFNALTWTADNFNNIRIRYTTGAHDGFYVDFSYLQKGITPPPNVVTDTSNIHYRLDTLGNHLDSSKANLRTEISAKLNISDTAAMLLPYRHWTEGYLKAADIAGKLNISDTAAMLAPYALLSEVPAQFNPIAGTNMSLSGSYPNITFNATGGGGSSQWRDTTNGIYYNAGNVGIGTLNPKYRLEVFNEDPIATYPTYANAYSTTLENPYYTGSCIRVRRSSDNTEQDFGFVGLHLDTTALKTFVGSGDGRVTTWYNQFGTSNFVQTLNARQPHIILNGNVLYILEKPAITFLWNASHMSNVGIPYSAGQKRWVRVNFKIDSLYSTGVVLGSNIIYGMYSSATTQYFQETSARAYTPAFAFTNPTSVLLDSNIAIANNTSTTVAFGVPAITTWLLGINNNANQKLRGRMSSIFFDSIGVAPAYDTVAINGELQANRLNIKNLNTIGDTTIWKPMVINATGRVEQMNRWVRPSDAMPIDSIALRRIGTHYIAWNSGGAAAGNSGGSGSNNLFIGARSGQSVSTGSNNKAFGVAALKAITTGSRNIVIGDSSMPNSTTANDGIVIGNNSGISPNNSYQGSVVLGNGSAVGTISLTNSVAVGSLALSNYYGAGGSVTNQIAIGYNANIYGFVGVAVGTDAGNGITVGTKDNIVIGNFAKKSTTGSDTRNSVIIGHNALTNSTGGGGSVIIGGGLASVPTGGWFTGDVIIGAGAMNGSPSLTSSRDNIVIGAGANFSGANPRYTTAIGISVDGGGGQDNIIIGRALSPMAISSNNQINIGGRWKHFTGNGALIDIAGGTATQTPSATFEVNGTTGGALFPRMTNAQKIAISSPADGLQVYCTDCLDNGGVNAGVMQVYQLSTTTWKNLY